MLGASWGRSNGENAARLEGDGASNPGLVVFSLCVLTRVCSRTGNRCDCRRELRHRGGWEGRVLVLKRAWEWWMGPFMSSSNGSPGIIQQVLPVIFFPLQVMLKTEGARVRSQVGSASSGFGTGALSPHHSVALSLFNSCLSFQALSRPLLLGEGATGRLCAGPQRHE